MKKIHLILFLIIGAFVFNSCNDDNETAKLELGDLPPSSQEFLTKFFPDNKVISISLDNPNEEFAAALTAKGGSGNENINLYVLLKDNICVVFNRNSGGWTYVSAENEIPLSATKILDEYVYQQLKRKEPQAKIMSLLPIYDHSIVITLDNTHRYAQSQLLAYEGTTLAEADITDENFKNKLTEFLKRNKSDGLASIGQVFKITEEEGVAYRLFITNALVISFNENGDWIHAEINENVGNTETFGAVKTLERIAENEIPVSVSDAVNTQSDLGNIRIMASYGSGNYGFRFSNHKDFLVNDKTGIVPPPITSAQKLITDYFEDTTYKPLYPGGLTLPGAYDYSYAFIFDGKENSISIDTDMNGKWEGIKSFYIEGAKAIYVSLPPKMIEELPSNSIVYLNENFKDGEIYSLTHKNGRYCVNVNKLYVIYFNEDGSYKTTVEYREPSL